MLTLRRLTKNSVCAAPIYNATARCCSTQTPKPSPNETPSSARYDKLINAAGRNRDFAAVRHFLTERMSDGCLNTTRTFKFIVTDLSVLDELLENLAEIDDWFTRRNAHNALVSQLARLHRTAEALRVAETMVRKNYGAKAVTFHPILNALLRKKNMSAAWRVVEAMRACNVQPVLTTFNYILMAYCVNGDVAAAAETLVKMEAEGIRADATTYDALVFGACRSRKVEGALAVMRRMVEDGVPPLFSTYTHIIKEMVWRGYYAQAVEFVRIFSGSDEKLDAENYGFLASRLKNMKEAKAVLNDLEKMLKRRGLPVGWIEGFISKIPCQKY